MQAAGADLFYEVVHKHWGHLLPALQGQKPSIPCVLVDDGPDETSVGLKAEKVLVKKERAPGQRVKQEVVFMEIEDSEDENEAEEWSKLEESMDLAQIEDRIAYLKCPAIHLKNAFGFGSIYI